MGKLGARAKQQQTQTQTLQQQHGGKNECIGPRMRPLLHTGAQPRCSGWRQGGRWGNPADQALRYACAATQAAAARLTGSGRHTGQSGQGSGARHSARCRPGMARHQEPVEHKAKMMRAGCTVSSAARICSSGRRPWSRQQGRQHGCTPAARRACLCICWHACIGGILAAGMHVRTHDGCCCRAAA